MTDAEWAVVRDAMPVPAWLEGRGGQPESYCHRQLVDAVCYLNRGRHCRESGACGLPRMEPLRRFLNRPRPQISVHQPPRPSSPRTDQFSFRATRADRRNPRTSRRTGVSVYQSGSLMADGSWARTGIHRSACLMSARHTACWTHRRGARLHRRPPATTPRCCPKGGPSAVARYPPATHRAEGDVDDAIGHHRREDLIRTDFGGPAFASRGRINRIRLGHHIPIGDFRDPCACDVDDAVGHRWRRAQAGLGVEGPALPPGIRVHRVELAVVAADVDDAVDHRRRRAHLPARGEGPALLSAPRVHRVQPTVVTAEVHDPVNHRRRRAHHSTGGEGPVSGVHREVAGHGPGVILCAGARAGRAGQSAV